MFQVLDQTYEEIIEIIQSHTVVSSGVFGVCE
jgi:hypothetical protein